MTLLDRGIIYIAYGAKSEQVMSYSISSLKDIHSYPVKVINGEHEQASDRQASRWAKVNLFHLSPFQDTLYLDADTRVQGDLSTGFDILDDGFDMAIVPSGNQDGDCLWHVGEDEREATFHEIGFVPIQLQAGVFYFRKSPAMLTLFAAWRKEWRRFNDQDQGALLRALYRHPVKVWLLGRPYNGGQVIAHNFGVAR